MFFGMMFKAEAKFLMTDRDLALHVHLTRGIIGSVLQSTETRFNEHDTVMDQRMEESVLIGRKAVLTMGIEQFLGNNAAVVLNRHDQVGVLRQMLNCVLADLLYLIDTVDFFIFFDEFSLFVDRFFDIGQLALDHLDPFHVDNTVIRVTGELIIAFIGVRQSRCQILARIVTVEGVFHLGIYSVVSAIINHVAHSFMSGSVIC